MKETVTDVTKKRQQKCFVHFCRMNNTRVPEMVYEWKKEGRGNKGQQAISWNPGIHKIRNFDISIEDANDKDG